MIRTAVRAESLQCLAGCIGHMTADEILERSIDDHADLSCPACGRIHLNREEIDLVEQDLIIHSDRYRALCLQAVADTLPGGPVSRQDRSPTDIPADLYPGLGATASGPPAGIVRKAGI